MIKDTGAPKAGAKGARAHSGFWVKKITQKLCTFYSAFEIFAIS